MTILPAKRSANAAEESNDNNTQNVTADRAGRRRDEHNTHNSNDPNKSVRRNQLIRRSTTPEPNELCLRKRFKESKPPRRKQARERKGKRSEIAQEENIEKSNPSSTVDVAIPETSDNNGAADSIDTEDATGFNSEDEYGSQVRPLKDQHLTDEEWTSRDTLFARCIADIGYEIKQMNEDGACLFRAIADQIYGDQELHYMVRSSCMDYIVKNKDFFAAYVTEDFDKYIARKRKWNVHGNHLEIQALSEMYNRTIEVYCYQIEPINIFNGTRLSTDEPIRLSYHRMCHYNSISNPNNPSVLVGLGLPAYHTIDLNRRRMVDAVRASEELLIEQTMLEDKLKATDWEATNEALEEEVARESYIQYFRDAEKRLKPQGHSSSSSSSTITSNVCASPRASRRGSVSPKGGMSPKGNASPKSAGYSTLSTTRVSTRNNTLSSLCANSDYETTSLVPYVPAESEIKFGEHKPNGPANQSPKSQPVFSDYDSHFNTGYPNFNDVCKRIESVNRADSIANQDGPSKSNNIHQPAEIGTDMISDEDWDDGIMAQVLAESRKTYLDDLKRNSKKRHGSPGPSTSR